MRLMKKRILIILLAAAALSGPGAQERTAVWEGTASMSRYGEFPVSGFYAASNSFSRNTLISVENLQNGRKTTVIISDRLNNPGLFLLLSQDAAGALGISQDETVRIRVTRAEETSDVVELAANDAPYNQDPDLNPAAGVDSEAYLRKPEQPAEKVFDETPEYQAIADDEAPRIVNGTPKSPDEEELAAADPDVPEAPAERTADSESPALSPAMPESPDREPEAVAELAEPEGPESAEEKESPDIGTGIPVSPEAPPVVFDSLGEPDVPEEEFGGPESPEIAEVPEPSEKAEEEELLLGLVDEPEQPDPETEEAETAEASEITAEEPPEIPEDAELVLEPAEPRPPEETAPETASAEVTEPAPPAPRGPEISVETAAAGPLETGGYYLQLGVFSESGNARNMAGSFSSAYPVSVYKEGAGTKTLYKVLLGPLNRDEGGSVLYTFRSRGYKDAFLRKNQ